MKVQIAHPSATPQQIEAHLRAVFPRYKVMSRAGVPIVGDGAATGVMIKPSGPGFVTLAWAFPNMGVQLILTLAIVLTGLLPGLILFGIVWLSVKGSVDRLKQEVSTVLSGGAAPVQQPLPSGGSPVPAPGAAAVVAAVICFVNAVLSIASFALGRAVGTGAVNTLFWIALGVGALMLHSEQKRAHETGTPQLGPGRLIIAVPAILHGLMALPRVIDADGLYLVRGIIASLFWVVTGVMLIVAHTKKTPGPRFVPAQMVAGGVLILFALFAIYDLVEFIDRGIELALFLGLDVVLWIVLGAMVIARAAGLGRVAPQPAAPPQPVYAVQSYPQYPAQPYPQQQQYQQPGQWPPQNS